MKVERRKKKCGKNSNIVHDEFKHLLAIDTILLYLNALNMVWYKYLKWFHVQNRLVDLNVFSRIVRELCTAFLCIYILPLRYSTYFRWNYINHLHLINKFSILKKEFARQFHRTRKRKGEKNVSTRKRDRCKRGSIFLKQDRKRYVKLYIWNRKRRFISIGMWVSNTVYVRVHHTFVLIVRFI